MDRLYPGTSETILVVEDDPLVLKFLRASLAQAGFNVLSAEGPEDARRIEADHPGPIHLLVSDVIMPHTSGPDLASEFKARRPAMRVILISGHPDDVRIQTYAGTFLQKPFLPGELVGTVKRVLHGAGANCSTASG